VSGSTEEPERIRADREAGSSRIVRLQPVRVAKVVGAAVSFAATLVGLIFVLWPALKPDGLPVAKGASVTDVTLDRASFGQYLARVAVSRSGYPQAQLKRPGVLVGVELKVKGYRDKRLPIRWQIVDERTGDQIQQSRDLFYTPSASEDQNTWSIWVPLPRGRGRRFFVEVELLDDRGAVPLGRARTHHFDGA